MKFVKISLFSAVLVLSGCAIGTKIDYSTGHIEFDEFSFNGSGGCAITVIDKRPYILSGDKEANFVGVRRGGYGNPFDVTTKSGNPMSQDLTELFSESYKEEIGVVCNTDSAPARKQVVYILNEWKTDFYSRGWFYYDIDTTVSINGAEISKQNIAGKLVLDSDFKLHDAITKVINEIHQDSATRSAFME